MNELNTLDGVATRRSRRGGALGLLGAVVVLVAIIGVILAGIFAYFRLFREPDLLRGTDQVPAPPLVAVDDPERGSIALAADGGIVA